MNGIPITNYTIQQVKKYFLIFIIALFGIFVSGNVINAIIKTKINVNPDSYTIKNGIPVFSDSDEYIKLIKTYPYDFGTKIKIYKIRPGESYWDVVMRNNITLDTLIAANPFIDSLLAKEGVEIVLPEENGVLLAADDVYDVWNMSKLLNCKDNISGDYTHSIFRLLSLDDIRFAFFKNAEPVIVNDSLEKLYAMRRIFQSPLNGSYTSMYGQRIDPFDHHGWEFHDGIDIDANYGDSFSPAREGIVTFTGWKNDLGKAIVIQHRDGYETTYGHCSSIEVVVGQKVSKKDIIGKIGSTGRSTGPHLHFMIKRHGESLNPLIFIW